MNLSLASDGNTASLVYPIWQKLNSLRDSYVVSSLLTDHYAVYVIFEVEHVNLPISHRFSDYSDANAQKFAQNINLGFYET